MALFTVYAYLTLSPREHDALLAAAAALTGLDASFKTLLGKLDTSGLTPEQEQQVADLIAALKQSGDALKAASAAQPPA